MEIESFNIKRTEIIIDTTLESDIQSAISTININIKRIEDMIFY